MTFIDLFAGIGGFRLALEQAGVTCVFSSEIDKHALQTYEANFGEKPYGDITTIDPHSIPDHDILCGGFPCQPFSQAGRGKGFEDARGTLIFSVAEILKAKQPKALLLENVRGLLSSNKGKDFELILSLLDSVGYDVSWSLLKASDYGLPTLRPRVYLVGIRKDLGNPIFSWPQPISLRFTMSDVLKARCDREIGYTIRKGGNGCKITDRHNWQMYYTDKGVRKLTVPEMKMMMGFPDSFVFPVSDTQAMKQIGNSVAVDMVRLIAQQIITILH